MELTKVVSEEKIQLGEKEVSTVRFEKTVSVPSQSQSVTFLELCRDTQNARNQMLACRNLVVEAWATMTTAQKKEWQVEYDNSMK
jgi:hypothetical protein